MQNNDYENENLNEEQNLVPKHNLDLEETHIEVTETEIVNKNDDEYKEAALKQRKTIINLFKFTIFIVSIFLIFSFKEEIAVFVHKISKPKILISTTKTNDYYKEEDYNYVQITDDFEITNYQHLLNAYYTVLNSGATSFTMKCSEDYKDCLEEVKALAEDKQTLSNINSFVHPYNSFESFETVYDTFGKISLSITKAYTKEQIQAVEEKMRDIVGTVTNPSLSHKENIRLVHDYIINNTAYDKKRSDSKTTESKYASDIAYGPLLQGFAICGGYTDAMALFLDYYNIKNYKVISENHIWNALELDGEWLHLDLTWDDPVMSDGSDRLEHTYFLIDYKKLLEVQEDQHHFDKEVFSEVAK